MSGATLAVLPYLQGWDGNRLDVRLLILPRIDPLQPLVGDSPAFPLANFVFEVRFLPGLSELPTTGSGTLIQTQSLPVVPTANALFQGILSQLESADLGIDPSPPPVGRVPEPGAPPLPIFNVRKHLPLSYQAAVGYVPQPPPELCSTDDTYSCMLKMRTVPQTNYTQVVPSKLVPWGRLIAALLRRPKLAEAAGLVRPVNGIPIDPALLKSGGFLFFSLASTSDAVALDPDGIDIYASRVPSSNGPRDLFSPLLFPVVSSSSATPSTTTPPATDYGTIFAEVEDYDDGWAKAVHCTQPHQLDLMKDDDADNPGNTRPAKEIGIRIGWDDEQVTTWMDRQMSTDPSVVSLGAPLGVHGYRVDVQIAGTTDWTSLTAASGPCIINNVTYATYQAPIVNDELAVEVHPSQSLADPSGDFWLPIYFTNWTGPSLVTTDNARITLAGGPADDTTSGKVRGIPPGIPLTYGMNYNFRVRLMDHTGGGPSITSTPRRPGLSSIYLHRFRRWIRPLAPAIVTALPAVPDPANAPTVIEISRPLLQYPAVAFTQFYSNQDVVSQLMPKVPPHDQAHQYDPEPGLQDSDVDYVSIKVLVSSLHQDPLAIDGTYSLLYTTTRQFPTDLNGSVSISLNWTDVRDITQLEGTDTATGPLPLPTARDIRLRIAAVGRDDPHADYFGADDVRQGLEKIIALRSNSTDERQLLLAPPNSSDQFNAYFLQKKPR